MFGIIGALYLAVAIVYFLSNRQAHALIKEEFKRREIELTANHAASFLFLLYGSALLWPVSVYNRGWRSLLVPRTQEEIETIVTKHIEKL